MKIGITERGDASVHFDEWMSKIDTVDGAILITKDPETILNRYNEIPWDKCVLHCTITGYGGTAIEPHVPDLIHTTRAYLELVKRLGGERVVLRIDPIIPHTNGVNLASLVYHLANSGRVRISILDMYNHIKSNFSDEVRNIYGGSIHATLEVRRDIIKLFPDAEVCGEPGIDCTGCISERDLNVMGLASTKQESLNREQPALAWV